MSSTFDDFQLERDALQRWVYPKLKKFCESAGFVFQAIDLRWGVSDEAARDNRAMRICLRELHRCQGTGLKPNFLLLLGNRYGSRPLPEVLPGALFEKLAGYLRSTESATLLTRWYKRDENAVPPVAELLPRGSGDREWRDDVERPLLAMLERAVHDLRIDPASEGVMIGASATEQEIVEGALRVPDAEAHVVAFFRSIEGLPVDSFPERFVDPPGGEDEARLQSLKRRVREHVGAANIATYCVPWRGALSAEDLEEFCDRAFERLLQVIERQIANAADLEDDEQAHAEFGDERRQHFRGRADALQAVRSYLLSDVGGPFFLMGPPGAGKSATIAQAVDEARRSKPDGCEIVARFVGATPASSNLASLLRNLVVVIRKRYPPREPPQEQRGRSGQDDAHVPIAIEDLVEAFLDGLGRASRRRPIWLFLDAVDQLVGEDALRLRWLTKSMPPYARVVVSMTPSSLAATALEELVGPTQRFALTPLGVEEGAQILLDFLETRNRTLQPLQQKAVLDAFRLAPSPLWLRVAAEEVLQLASWQTAPQFSLGVDGLLFQVLERLAREDEHGLVIVSRALSYLVWARHGLAENELIELLSSDAEVIEDFRHRSPRSPHTNTLPAAVWVRLYGDIAPYLRHAAAYGTSLLSFYHQSFRAAAANFSQGLDDRQTVHGRLARYFSKKLNPDGEIKWSGQDLHALAELPIQQYLSERWKDLEDTLTDLRFVQKKCANQMVLELLADYSEVEVASVHIGSIITTAKHWRGHLGASCPRCRHCFEVRSADLGASIICPSCRGDLILNPFAVKGAWISAPSNRSPAVHGERCPEQLRTQLAAFANFLMRQSHALTKNPSLVYQQAANEPEDSIVRKALQVLEAEGLEIGPYFRLKNGERQNTSCLLVLSNVRAHRVGFSDDGLRLLALGSGGLAAWKLASGRACDPLEEDGAKFSKGQSHNGLIAVTVDSSLDARNGKIEGIVVVSDVNSGAQLARLSGHDGIIADYRFTPDDDILITVAHFGPIRIWDAATWRELRRLTPGAMGERLAISPDGRILASFAYSKIRVWDIASGESVIEIKHGQYRRIHDCSFSPDGGMICSASEDRTAKVWDAGSGVVLDTFIGHSEEVWSCAFSPDGRFLATQSHDNTIRVWALGASSGLASVESPGSPISACASSPSTREIVTAGRWGGMKVFEPPDYSNLKGKEFGRSDRAFALSVDGRLAAVAGGDYGNAALIVDLVSMRELASVRHEGALNDCAFSPDGRVLAVAAGGYFDSMGDIPADLHFYETRSGTLAKRLRAPICGVSNCAFTSDGEFLLAASDFHQLDVWNSGSGELVRTFEGRGPMSISPDGRRVVASYGRNGPRPSENLRVWNIVSGSTQSDLMGRPGEAVEIVSFSPDCVHVAAGCDVGWGKPAVLRVWNGLTGAQEALLPGRVGKVSVCTFSPDGRLLMAAFSGSELLCWDWKANRLLAEFPADAEIGSAVWAWGDRTAILGDGLGRLRLIRCENEKSGAPLVSAFRIFDADKRCHAERLSITCPCCGARSDVELDCAPPLLQTSCSACLSDLELSSAG